MHPFEIAGLGHEPYKFLNVDYKADRDRCEYCHQPIHYRFWIQSACGMKFTVGSECVKKVDKYLGRVCMKALKLFKEDQEMTAEEQGFLGWV